MDEDLKEITTTIPRGLFKEMDRIVWLYQDMYENKDEFIRSAISREVRRFKNNEGEE